MANKHPIDAALKEALAATRHAQATRAFHRRRTLKGSDQREQDLYEAADRVRRAMVPLRSFLGAAPFRSQTRSHRDMVERVRQASHALQSERRKLWKMSERNGHQTKAKK